MNMPTPLCVVNDRWTELPPAADNAWTTPSGTISYSDHWQLPVGSTCKRIWTIPSNSKEHCFCLFEMGGKSESGGSAVLACTDRGARLVPTGQKLATWLAAQHPNTHGSFIGGTKGPLLTVECVRDQFHTTSVQVRKHSLELNDRDLIIRTEQIALGILGTVAREMSAIGLTQVIEAAVAKANCTACRKGAAFHFASSMNRCRSIRRQPLAYVRPRYK